MISVRWLMSGLLISSVVAIASAAPDGGNSVCFLTELSLISQASRHQDLNALATLAATTRCPELADSWKAEYLSGYLHYRFARLVPKSQAKARDQALEKTIDALQRAIVLNERCAVCHALLSAAYGMKIAGHPIRGMTLGPKASRHMARAHEIGTEKATVDLLDGIGKLHTPGLFGGGLEKSLALIKSAYESMKTDEPDLGWGLADASLWYGIALADSGDSEAARHLFEQALRLEADFVAVKRRMELLKGN